MFLHERSQTVLCRIGFVVLCVLPTLAIAGWAVWLRQPPHRQRLERKLSRTCGLDVSIGRVQYPRQGVARAFEVTLRDPATGDVVASAPWVEVSIAANATRVHVARAAVDARIRQPLVDFVQRKLHRRGGPGGNLWLVGDEVVWQNGDEKDRLVQIRAGCEAGDDADQAFLSFKTQADAPADSPRMRIVRSRGGKSALYEVQLHTGTSDLPCRLLEGLGAPLRWLGPEATFRGSLWSYRVDDEWLTQVTGMIRRARLEALLGSVSPHRLTGQVDIELAAPAGLRLRGARVERLAAHVMAGPGEVSVSLLSAAFQCLEMPSVASPVGTPRSESQPYERLAFDVGIDSQGVEIVGRCDQGGAVLCDRQGALLTQPRGRQNVARIVDFLAPATRPLISANLQAQRLAAVLPLAEPRPTNAARGERIGVRAR